ncbi:MAG: OmpA family protein [Magnetospirillum sp. WYHS-4]
MMGVYRLAFLAASVAVLGLSACSSVPDAINPVEWYKGAVGDEDKGVDAPAPASAQAEQMDKAAKDVKQRDFPTLESVPERSLGKAAKPSGNSSGGGLSGDGAGRRYASDSIARQGDAVSSLDAEGVAAVEQRTATIKAAGAAPAPTAPATAGTPAAAMPQATALPPSSPKPMTVMEAYQAALAQTRPNPQGAAPAYAAPASGDYGTVVVGGGGIEGGTAAMPMAAGQAGMPSAGMIRIATIQFGDGSTSLDDTDRQVLRQVRALHKQHGGRIHVIGHSSSRTRSMTPEQHQQVNRRLSDQRAGAVAQELGRLGVSSGAISTEARGDAEPVFYEVMPTGEAGNRRAEVFLAY